MTKLHIYYRAGYFLLLLITAGCTSQSGWETQSASPEFVNGTRILAEVVMITTRDESLSNKGLLLGWRDKLISAGYTDNDIVDGSEITIFTYCYGWNSGVSICAHHGHYVAHVPVELQGKLKGDLDATWDTSGDLVEVELNKTPKGYIVGKVVRLFRKSDDWSPCRKASLEQVSEASAYSLLSRALAQLEPCGLSVMSRMQEGGLDVQFSTGHNLRDRPYLNGLNYSYYFTMG